MIDMSAKHSAQSNHRSSEIPLRRYESSAKMQRIPLGGGDPVQRCQWRCARWTAGPQYNVRMIFCSRLKRNRVLEFESEGFEKFGRDLVLEEVLGGSATSKSNQHGFEL